jgi:hypothetical protein
MSQILVASADDIIEQIIIKCWLHQARAGDHAGARQQAERTLERLLARGLAYKNGPGGALLLDPYAANNAVMSRAGDAADESWPFWQETTRRNAASLPAEARNYRFTMRREWHAYAVSPGRPLVFRMPLPLRGTQRGPAKVRLIHPADALIDLRETPGRVELRLDAAATNGPVVAELEVAFVGGEVRDTSAPSAPLGEGVGPQDHVWLREREGLIAPSPAIAALAAEMGRESATARDFVLAVWDRLIGKLRIGDVHRDDLDPDDPLGALLQGRVADCVLASSLLVAICRARGIPARVLSGFLLHPANLAPHSWAEVRIGADNWVPFDLGTWAYCAGNPHDPDWGHYFFGRLDARFIAEIAPRDFTGWGSAPPPAHWYRLERLCGDKIEHTLHALPDGTVTRRDIIGLEMLGTAA